MASGADGRTEWPAAGLAALLAVGSAASMAAEKERSPRSAAKTSGEEAEFDSTSVAWCSPKLGVGVRECPIAGLSDKTLDRSLPACGSSQNPISCRSTPHYSPDPCGCAAGETLWRRKLPYRARPGIFFCVSRLPLRLASAPPSLTPQHSGSSASGAPPPR